ncbi:7950_t:CDS:2 [Ambispora gerdemannii]|uniref:7950_t:CDS:1 n=1 Tax=Ambispora gerdemannii TaxID=144530 RepID=A0A9N9DD43_9GLOM|nr:7950_t:CDS:2 [Ambispora gerdemannii]
MHLSTDCLNALKTHEFWKSTDDPSLKKFLDFRFQKGVLEDKKTEYSQYKSELDTIKGYYSETLSCISSVTNYPVNCGWQWEKTAVSCTPSSTTLPIVVGSGKRSRSVGEHALDKKSQSLISFWDLQTKRQTIHMNSKILEEEAQLQQFGFNLAKNELKNQIHIERTRQILDATKGIRNQDYLLREITTKQIEKDLLNELYAKNENLEEEAPSTPPDKIKTVPFNKQENDAIASDSDDDSQNATESMIGKVERTTLIVDNVDLEKIFEDYRNDCENIYLLF